jgi:hypothetical protein
MAEAILNVDAEQLIIAHLAAALAEPVSQRIPSPRPSAFVTVRRTGGVRREVVIDAAQITVDAWGDTPAAAHDLAQSVRSLIHAMVGVPLTGAVVVRVDEFAGPGYFPDDVSDQDRYTATYSVHLR